MSQGKPKSGRIYVVTNRASRKVHRYVRAPNLNRAVRAASAEFFEARAATTDDVYLAMKQGADVLDALAMIDADALDATGE